MAGGRGSGGAAVSLPSGARNPGSPLSLQGHLRGLPVSPGGGQYLLPTQPPLEPPGSVEEGSRVPAPWGILWYHPSRMERGARGQGSALSFCT